MQEHARICKNGCIKDWDWEFPNYAVFTHGKLKITVNASSRIEEFKEPIDWTIFLRFSNSLKWEWQAKTYCVHKII